MIRQMCVSVVIASTLFGAQAIAQEQGRTDGPEGSEYGKGGYVRASGDGRFALGADFGGELVPAIPLGGTSLPLYVGLTASMWLNDWFVIDLSPTYAFASKRFNVLVGPKFRTFGWPVSFSAGLKVGPGIPTAASTLGPESPVYFMLSPQVGVDMVFAKHVVMGLQGAFDLPIGSPAWSTRIGLHIGWRF